MAKKIRISDIARTAGVSPGTVDRVIHNRGRVSPAARESVEKALAKLDYRPNIHISAISLRKKYRIVVTTPQFSAGEYWSIIHKGVQRAVREFDSLDIECKVLCYDQFDLFSCRSTFEQAAKLNADAVIIGATFRDETVVLTNHLEDNNIPYVYVDSMVEGTYPLAFFSSDHYTCGRLIGKLITGICPSDSSFVLFQAVRTGDASANTTILRKKGFMDFCHEKGIAESVIRAPFSVTEPEKNKELIGNLFARHPEAKGAIVLSSRGNVIAEYLRTHGVGGVRIVGIDLTDGNMEAIGSGRIDFVVGQRPEQQGFMAVKALIQKMVYGRAPKSENYLPMDIITRENAAYYCEFADTTI